MAGYNEILIGRWNHFLQKIASIKGAAVTPQLASDVQPILDMESVPVESRFLLGWNRFGLGLQQPAVGAQISIFRLRNPAASSVIAVVESLEIVVGTAAVAATDFINVTYGKIATDLGSTNTPGTIDGRSGAGSSSIVSSNGSSGAPSTLARIAFLLRGASFSQQWLYTRNQEIPIAPGFALQIETVTVNLPLTISAIWRERILEESELK